jgi:hypothetical protein
MRICNAFSLFNDSRSLAFFKHIYSILFLSGVTVFTTGCSSYPAQPQFSLWNTGPSDSAPSSYAAQSFMPLSDNSTASGWGSYSGARGQSVPQGSETYVYRGDRDRREEVTRAQM